MAITGGGAIKFNVKVEGVQNFRTALKLLDQGAQTRTRSAIRETTSKVRDAARQRVPLSAPKDRKAKHRMGPGELRDTIRDDYTADGFVGFVKAGFGKLKRRSKRTAKPKRLGPERFSTYMRRQHREALAMDAARGAGVYAMVVEFGAKDRPANPYLRPSAHGERAQHHDRLRAALKGGVNDAARGARGGPA